MFDQEWAVFGLDVRDDFVGELTISQSSTIWRLVDFAFYPETAIELILRDLRVLRGDRGR